MAITVARVHLAMAHAALPGLLPTPPKWMMLPLFPTPPCVAAVVFPKPLAKPSRADIDERWDAPKATKPASPSASSSSSSSGSPRSSGCVRSVAGHGSLRKNATSPQPKPGRADSVERWDAHKKAASQALSSSSSRTSSVVSSSKWPISRATSAERWGVHKERRPPHADQRLDDGESSSAGSNDVDTEEILWKPRALYAGPGFVVAAPEAGMLPMPTAFLIPVA